jgi:hypothetical protein
MERMNLRAANKAKHPGLVDLSPPRRTHNQKRANDERAGEDKQAREEAHANGICRIAEVENRTAQKLVELMKPDGGPRTVGSRVPARPTTMRTTADLAAGTGKYMHIQPRTEYTDLLSW